jgi:hypothetical protein
LTFNFTNIFRNYNRNSKYVPHIRSVLINLISKFNVPDWMRIPYSVTRNIYVSQGQVPKSRRLHAPSLKPHNNPSLCSSSLLNPSYPPLPAASFFAFFFSFSPCSPSFTYYFSAYFSSPRLIHLFFLFLLVHVLRILLLLPFILPPYLFVLPALLSLFSSFLCLSYSKPPPTLSSLASLFFLFSFISLYIICLSLISVFSFFCFLIILPLTSFSCLFLFSLFSALYLL